MGVEVQGLEELKRKFEEIPKALRRRVLRNALSAGARLVRDEAKRNAPILQNRFKAPYRTPGTVKNAIKVRISKLDKRAGNVGVFVNVKPAKAGNRGAKNPNDPFYWRWLEFGTKKMPERPFLRKGAEKLGAALTSFEASIAKWMTKVDNGAQVQ
jgi:HK97 gp10 family phage protein